MVLRIDLWGMVRSLSHAKYNRTLHFPHCGQSSRWGTFHELCHPPKTYTRKEKKKPTDIGFSNSTFTSLMLHMEIGSHIDTDRNLYDFMYTKSYPHSIHPCFYISTFSSFRPPSVSYLVKIDKYKLQYSHLISTKP